jgi:hypothetical protein
MRGNKIERIILLNWADRNKTDNVRIRQHWGRSYNHCCSRKTISVTYSDCLFLALVMQHVKRVSLLYCRLWYVRLCNIFQHYFINDAIFGNKAIVHKLCVLIFPTTLFWNVSHYKKNWAWHYRKRIWYVCLHVTYRYSCQILMRLQVSRQIFEK